MIANGPKVSLSLPSVTDIDMFEYLPTSRPCGVPQSRPLDVLKDAQPGFPEIEKTSTSSFGSLAVGLNE